MYDVMFDETIAKCSSDTRLQPRCGLFREESIQLLVYPVQTHCVK